MRLICRVAWSPPRISMPTSAGVTSRGANVLIGGDPGDRKLAIGRSRQREGRVYRQVERVGQPGEDIGPPAESLPTAAVRSDIDRAAQNHQRELVLPGLERPRLTLSQAAGLEMDGVPTCGLGRDLDKDVRVGTRAGVDDQVLSGVLAHAYILFPKGRPGATRLRAHICINRAGGPRALYQARGGR